MPDLAQIARLPGTKTRNDSAGSFGAAERRVRRQRLFILCFLGAVLVVYVGLALRISAAKAPWIDEGWISISTLNFLEHGKTGNPVMDPGGFWIGQYLPGIRETNYLNMPLTLLIQALWFKIFGFGVLPMRALSMLWGAVAIVTWFAIVKRFAGLAAACLSVPLLAVDFTFLSSAADGRMDMWCMCLWSLGLICYLQLQNRSFTRALVVSNAFIAASVFTHPNGIIGIVLLAAFVWTDHRRDLRWSHIFLLWPYVVGVGIWLAFIVAAPSDFLAQFTVNSGKQSGKLNIFLPWVSVLNEFWIRYVLHFGGWAPWSAPLPKRAHFVILIYWLAAGFVLIQAWRSGSAAARNVIKVTAIVAGCLTFLIGFKSPNYVIHVIPAYVACMALASVMLFRLSNIGRILSVAALVILLGFQIDAIRYKFLNAEYDDYRATVDYVRTHLRKDAHIDASSAFFFDLPDYHINDDLRLGYNSYRPDFVIIDKWYRFHLSETFYRQNLDVALYANDMLRHHMKEIYEHGEDVVYEVSDPPLRLPPGSPPTGLSETR